MASMFKRVPPYLGTPPSPVLDTSQVPVEDEEAAAAPGSGAAGIWGFRAFPFKGLRALGTGS